MHGVHPSALQDVWFGLIAVLWIGYFVLEGFDFGVGILMPLLARNDTERRIALNTLGPVWDGNEVWLLTAGGATFAAFPTWYADVFSAFYIPLFLMLAALIARIVAFEFRHRNHAPEWKSWWDRAIVFGSFIPALLWGVAFSDLVAGVPINKNGAWTGNFFSLIHPYALLGGLVTLSLFCLHGCVFLSLKTVGDLSERARAFASRLALPAAGILTVWLGWTYANARHVHDTGIVPGPVPVACLAAILAASWLISARLNGWAFVATATGLLLLVVTYFLDLYPKVLVSSTNHAYSLTIPAAASHPYTLKVMTVVAVIFTPFVLAYQGWTYWVFRHRLGNPAVTSPEASSASLLSRSKGKSKAELDGDAKSEETDTEPVSPGEAKS